MATNRWQGKAIAVAQLDTMTVGGTWLAAETATLTSNDKDIVLTLGGSALTTADVALALKEMWNGTAQTASDNTVSETGDNVLEFNEATAGNSGSTMTATGNTAGTPFVFTEATDSSSGTLVIANTTAATGPNHAGDTSNWSAGSLPVDSDDVVWDSGAVDVLYGLASLTAVTPGTVTIGMGFTGKIGLPLTNAGGYPEYRQRELQFCQAADSLCTVKIGGGSGSGSSRLFFDFQDGDVAVVVTDTGSAESTSVPTFTFIGSNVANTLNVTKGDVGCAVVAGQVCELAAINVSYSTQQSTDASLTLGPGVNFNTSAVTQNGGGVDNLAESALTALTILNGTFTHRGAAVTAANVEGGSLIYQSDSTLSSLVVAGGATADFSQDPRAVTVSACEVHKGATLKDPAKSVTFSADIDLMHCSLTDVTLDIGSHFTLSRGAV